MKILCCFLSLLLILSCAGCAETTVTPTQPVTEPRSEEAAKCPNCDAELDAGAKFCTNCGESLIASEPPEDLLSAERETLNRFLSHFEIAWMDNYDTIPTFAQVDFAYSYCKHNHYDEMIVAVEDSPYEWGSYAFHKDLISQVVDEFFGVTLSHPDKDHEYTEYLCYTADGYYHAEAADGAYAGYLTLAEDAVLNEDGLYEITFTSYVIDSGYFFDMNEDASEFCGYTAEEAAKDPVLSVHRTGTAVVEYVAEGQYHLMGYRTEQ